MPSPDHPLGVRRSPEGEMHGGDTGAKVQKCKGETRGHVGMVTRGHGEMHRFGWQVAGTGGGWRAENIFGSQVSAVGYRIRVFRFGCGYWPEPVPGAEYLNLTTEGRDLGPENES